MDFVGVDDADGFFKHHLGHHAVRKTVGEFDGVVASSGHFAFSRDGNGFDAVFLGYVKVGIVVQSGLLPIT